VSARGEGYLHVGPLLFIRQLQAILAATGTAAILEYSATELNTPSLFFNDSGEVHTKCGIDFPQLAAYAGRLGFRTAVVPIEEILGIRADQEFLSVDVFTREDLVAGIVPVDASLRRLRGLLPVRAYTRSALRSALMEGGLPLAPSEAEPMLAILDPCFFPIRDPRFDATNPTIWGYNCLLLSKA
jgi:hypothetical protein